MEITEKTWDITDKEDLVKVAREVRSILLADEHYPKVLALSGDLGAGKTTFVQALGELLGVEEEITSPTFVIMKGYDLPEQVGVHKKFAHVDAYRLDSAEEMVVLGFKEILKDENFIICIEWAEKIQELLPVETVWLHFSLDGDSRQLKITSNQHA